MVDSEVPDPDREDVRQRALDKELEFDSLSIKPLLGVDHAQLVRHRLGQPPHLVLKV